MAEQTRGLSAIGNSYIDSLLSGVQWGLGSTIAFSFNRATLLNIKTYDWSPDAKQAIRDAFSSISAVTNLSFVEGDLDSESSDIALWITDNSFFLTFFGETGILGGMLFPDPETQEQVIGGFNASMAAFNYLDPGGLAFATAIHEIGHGLGLAHPHDGAPLIDNNPTKFPGVTGEYSYGTYNQNQGVYTMMSYNDGWSEEVVEAYEYGHQKTPMAFDVYALQQIYGQNTTTGNIDNVYELPNINAVGTGWSCIWDVGGSDTITAASANSSCTINLNAAPLTGRNAGGFVSWQQYIQGGFTIAHGVLIEHAIGSDFDDIITGNETQNNLLGGAGDDRISAGADDDSITGGSGNDVIDGGSGIDTAVYEFNYNTYTFTRQGSKLFVQSLTEGRDTLTNIEYLGFDDYNIRSQNIGYGSVEAIVFQNEVNHGVYILSSGYFAVQGTLNEDEILTDGVVLKTNKGGKFTYNTRTFATKYADIDADSNEVTVIFKYGSNYYDDSFNATTGKFISRQKYTNTTIIDLENRLSTDLNGDSYVGSVRSDQISYPEDYSSRYSLYKHSHGKYEINSTNLNGVTESEQEVTVFLKSGRNFNVFSGKDTILYAGQMGVINARNEPDVAYYVLYKNRGQYYEKFFNDDTGQLMPSYTDRLDVNELIDREAAFSMDLNGDGGFGDIRVSDLIGNTDAQYSVYKTARGQYQLDASGLQRFNVSDGMFVEPLYLKIGNSNAFRASDNIKYATMMLDDKTADLIVYIVYKRGNTYYEQLHSGVTGQYINNSKERMSLQELLADEQSWTLAEDANIDLNGDGLVGNQPANTYAYDDYEGLALSRDVLGRFVAHSGPVLLGDEVVLNNSSLLNRENLHTKAVGLLSDHMQDAKGDVTSTFNLFVNNNSLTQFNWSVYKFNNDGKYQGTSKISLASLLAIETLNGVDLNGDDSYGEALANLSLQSSFDAGYLYKSSASGAFVYSSDDISNYAVNHTGEGELQNYFDALGGVYLPLLRGSGVFKFNVNLVADIAYDGDNALAYLIYMDERGTTYYAAKFNADATSNAYGQWQQTFQAKSLGQQITLENNLGIDVNGDIIIGDGVSSTAADSYERDLYVTVSNKYFFYDPVSNLASGTELNTLTDPLYLKNANGRGYFNFGSAVILKEVSLEELYANGQSAIYYERGIGDRVQYYKATFNLSNGQLVTNQEISITQLLADEDIFYTLAADQGRSSADTSYFDINNDRGWGNLIYSMMNNSDNNQYATYQTTDGKYFVTYNTFSVGDDMGAQIEGQDPGVTLDSSSLFLKFANGSYFSFNSNENFMSSIDNDTLDAAAGTFSVFTQQGSRWYEYVFNGDNGKLIGSRKPISEYAIINKEELYKDSTVLGSTPQNVDLNGDGFEGIALTHIYSEDRRQQLYHVTNDQWVIANTFGFSNTNYETQALSEFLEETFGGASVFENYLYQRNGQKFIFNPDSYNVNGFYYDSTTGGYHFVYEKNNRIYLKIFDGETFKQINRRDIQKSDSQLIAMEEAYKSDIYNLGADSGYNDLNADGMIGDYLWRVKISAGSESISGLYQSKLGHYYLDTADRPEGSAFTGEQVKLMQDADTAFNFHSKAVFKSLVNWNDGAYSVFTTIRGKWYEYEFSGSTGMLNEVLRPTNYDIVRDEISINYDINNDGSIAQVNAVYWSVSDFMEGKPSDYHLYGAINDNTYVIDTTNLATADTFTDQAGVIFNALTDNFWTLADGDDIFDFTQIGDSDYYEILTTDGSSYDAWVLSMNFDDTYATIVNQTLDMAPVDQAMTDREYYYDNDFNADEDITAPLEIPEDWASYYNT